MADLKGVTACLKSFNTGKAWLPSSRLRQYNEKPGILHLSTNLYVSLSFAACQSWRSNGMTDKHILYGTSPESWAHGAVYRLLFISMTFISCQYKAKSKVAFGAEL